jgi:hypothetical protein
VTAARRRRTEGAGIRLGAGPFFVAAALICAGPAWARDWPAEKCRRYSEAWVAATQRIGTVGLSAEFLAAHGAFLASGCRERAACPRSRAEIAMADTMTVLALNAGMSGTFLPFICRP